MKNVIVILLLFFGCTNLRAQETIARFKYEDAEKAFVAQNYQECIDNLDEAEKLLGKTAPNILHLKILAQYKLIEKDPYGDFELLVALHNGCATYLRDYDIAGLEEKYRDVYEVQEGIKDYPKTQAEYTAFIENQKQEIRTIFENYINAIGGREALDQVKSLYIKGEQTMGKETTNFEDKMIVGKKSHAIYYHPLNGYGAKKKKLELLTKMVSTENGAFVVDMKGNKKNLENSLKAFPTKSLFPELDWVHLLESPNYDFKLKKENDYSSITILYKSDNLSHVTSMVCIYDSNTHLSTSKTVYYYPSSRPSEGLGKPIRYNHTNFEEFKQVGDIKLPFKRISFAVDKTIETNNVQKISQEISEISINEGVEPSDFEP